MPHRRSARDPAKGMRGHRMIVSSDARSPRDGRVRSRTCRPSWPAEGFRPSRDPPNGRYPPVHNDSAQHELVRRGLSTGHTRAGTLPSLLRGSTDGGTAPVPNTVSAHAAILRDPGFMMAELLPDMRRPADGPRLGPQRPSAIAALGAGCGSPTRARSKSCSLSRRAILANRPGSRGGRR